jgi:hypothetical protein
MLSRGDAGCFAFGVIWMKEGRFGQLHADGAAFLLFYPTWHLESQTSRFPLMIQQALHERIIKS